MTEPITILLIDDHEIIRSGIQAFLSALPDLKVVGEAGSGDIGVLKVQELVPDVVLLDLVMPNGIDGVETTRRIKQVSPHSNIIILTSFLQDEHIFPAIRAGALSYLLKDVTPPILAEAIRKAAKNEAILHPRVAARIVSEMHGTNDTANPFTILTKREIEILRLIADGKNNAAIAEELVLSIKTIKNHVGNILSKLHLADRTQAAVFAWQKGVVRRTDSLG